MKKIYILTAVFALLTLSLNAQTMASKKVANNTTTSTEKKAGMPMGGIHQALNIGINHAPLRATENVTDHITASALAATTTTYTNFSGVTFTSDAVYAGQSARNNSTNIQLRATNPSGIVTTTSGGKVKSITITVASGTNAIYVYGKNTAYSSGADLYSNATRGTLLGQTSSTGTITVNGDYEYIGIRANRNSVYISSIDVVWEREVVDPNVGSITVCDGQYNAQVLPVLGYFHDESQHNQMIYPASMLSAMAGKPIKSMTFYPTTGSFDANNDGTNETYNGINFYGGSVTFKLMNMNSGNPGFDSNNPTLITGTMTAVNTIVPARNTSATTWVINFDQDFTYTGGDLLIDVTNVAGNYGVTFFTVDEMPNYAGMYSYVYNGSTSSAGLSYLPKVTFTYDNSVLQHDLAIDLDAPAVAVAGSTVTVTATVTNNGDFDENGYTVTFTDGTSTVTRTATSTLGIGETATFTADFTTNANGQTADFTATVATTDDIVTANNTATASTTLKTCPPPENVQATAGDHQNATMTWEAPTIPSTMTSVNESFENGTTGWTFIDADGDGYNWYRHVNTGSGNYTVHTGNSVMASESFNNDSGSALSPDNWLISPEVSLDGFLTFWAAHQATYPENFAVYICQGSYNSVNDFVKISNDITTNASMTQYSYDLSQYNGQTGHIAIRHYNSRDNFILLIDDINYQTMVPGEQPVSYNIYLDGVLVDNVSSSTFSYDFSNVAGEHTCAVSAVYSYGESVAVPVTFSTTPKTATPTLSIVDSGNGTYTITATATSPDTDAEVTLNVTGQQPVTGTGSASVTITQGNAAQTVTATATAQATDKLVSNEASENFIVPALPITPTPAITYVVNGDNVVITATGQGEVTLNVTGQDPVTGNGTVSITLPRTDENYTVTATATAQAAYHQQSATATEQITIPFLQTEAPSITYSSDGESVTITATANEPDADAVVTLTVGNGEPVTGTGSVSVTVPCGVTSTSVTATATAKVDGKAQSETTTEQVPIPAGEGWLPMDGIYNDPHDLLTFKRNGKDIMLIDQFMASTVYNDQPDSYTYVMKETVDGEVLSSNPVSIPVYKTSSTLQGCYTQSQVDADVKMQLKPQVLNSAMYYDVHPDDYTLYYSLYHSDIDGDYPVIDVPHRVSQLQRFDEMDENEHVHFFFKENETSGVIPYYDQIGTQIVERLDTNYVQAGFGNELSYVPVIWTLGQYTGRADGKNNTYGSDIKREKLGKTEIINIGGSMSGQNNAENTGNGWEGYFTKDGVQYCIYTPIITIQGTTPERFVQHDGDISEYEPYMYRVWCLYDGAIDFGQNAQGILVGGDPIEPPFLLGEQVISDPNVDMVTIGRNWTAGQPRLQNSFAVPRSTNSADVKFAVRFYYRKKVTDAQAQVPNTLRANRDGSEENAYYIAEDDGNGSSIPVGVYEIFGGRTITDVTYVNAQGMTSDKPFDGLNIIITRYSDGTISTTKVIK